MAKSDKKVVRVKSTPASKAEEARESNWKPTPEAKSKAIGFRVIAGVLWLLASWASLFLPQPLPLIVGAIAQARIAVIDAVDIALAVRGVPGSRRLALMRCHRTDMRVGATLAAVLNMALGLTVIGWLAWFPALVCGAARLVLQWPDVSLEQKKA